MGRGRDRQRELGRVERRGTGEHGQDVAVGADAEHDEIEDRPALLLREVLPRATHRRVPRHTQPRRSRGRSTRPSGTGGCSRSGWARPTIRHRPSLPRRRRCPGGRRRTASRSRAGGRAARSDRRSTRRGPWPTGWRRQRSGQRGSARPGRTAGRDPVGAPATLDCVERGMGKQKRLHARDAAPRRPGHVAILSAASSAADLIVGNDDDLGLAHDGPPSGPINAAAARSAPTATGSRRPVSIASASRSASPRRGARKWRSRASTPSCQTRTWTVSASAVTSARNSEPRRSARSSTRRVVPAGIVLTTGRTTTATSARPSDRVAASPRPTAGLTVPPRGRPPFGGPGRAGDRGERLDHLEVEPRRQPADVVDRLDQVRRPGRAGLVVGRVGDRDPAQGAEVRQEVRIVEDRGDRLAPAGLPREREVGHDQPRPLDQLRHLAQPLEAITAPCRPVDDEPIGVGQQVEGRLALERRFARPPDRDRQVVDDQRRRDRRQVPAGFAAGDQVDRLGADLGRVRARHDAVRLDPAVEPRRPVRIGRLDDDRPRRMAPGQHLDRRRAAFGELGAARHDDQVHHARPRRDVAGLVAVGLDRLVLLRPRSWSARSRSRRCCGRVRSSAGSARRAWPASSLPWPE